MTWIQEAGSAQDALEIAKQREPEASIRVTKVSPGKYLISTSYPRGQVGKLRVTSASERVTPQGEARKEVIEGTTGGKDVYVVAEKRELSEEQRQAFEEEGAKGPQRVGHDRLVYELRHGVYTDSSSGTQYRLTEAGQEKLMKYGGEPRISDIEVRRPVPYKYEWIPYQSVMKEELYKSWGGTSPSKEYLQKQQIYRTMSSLTPEEQQRLSAETVSGQVERSMIAATDPYTKPEFFAASIDLLTPARVSVAAGAKIGQWATRSFTSLGTGAEVLARPEFYKSMTGIYQSGAMAFMARDIGSQTIKSALESPAEFAGEITTSALLFYGISRAGMKFKTVVRETVGPRVAMMTEGRFMSSLTKEFEAAKPTKFMRVGVQEEAHGSLPAAVVEGSQHRLNIGRVTIKPADFGKMVKNQGKKVTTIAEEYGSYQRGVKSMEIFEAEPARVTRTIYTYVKEKPPEGILYKFDKKTGKYTAEPYGGRKAHIRRFEPIDDVKIPARSARYSIEQYGDKFKRVEYGGFDIMIGKMKKPPEKVTPLVQKAGKPRPMRPFSAPDDVVEVARSSSKTVTTVSKRSGGNIQQAQKSSVYDETAYIRSDADISPFKPVVETGSMKITPALIIQPSDFTESIKATVAQSSMEEAQKMQERMMERTIENTKTEEKLVYDHLHKMDVKTASSQSQIFDTLQKQSQRQAYDFMRPEPVRITEYMPPPPTVTRGGKGGRASTDVIEKSLKKANKKMKEAHGFWIHPVADPLAPHGKVRRKKR